tara:strand:+ start:1568 stop:2644 length:1077 start_codon:yes stop_codon:yes gene_type:complete
MKKCFQVSDDISIAKTLLSDFYTETDIFELSKETIFTNSWQLISHAKILNNTTQYPFSFLDGFINEPLVITKQNNYIKCYSNVCTHRAHLICLDKSNQATLRCRYHGRTFKLDGKMKSMPGFNEVKNFPNNQDNLINIPTLLWQDFIFVSLNEGINIKPVLDDIDSRLKGYEFSKLILDKEQSKSYIIDSHWALYCENYLEEFHIPFVHKGLIQDINLNNYETILLENGVLQTAKCSNQKDAIKLNSNVSDSNKNMYAYYYWIFPNLMLNFYAWGLSVNIIEPLTTQKTRIKYMTFKFPNINIQTSDGADVGTIELEDQEVVQSVQRGVNSRYYKKGRYSTKYEIGVHHFHKIITKYV